MFAGTLAITLKNTRRMSAQRVKDGSHALFQNENPIIRLTRCLEYGYGGSTVRFPITKWSARFDSGL